MHAIIKAQSTHKGMHNNFFSYYCVHTIFNNEKVKTEKLYKLYKTAVCLLFCWTSLLLMCSTFQSANRLERQLLNQYIFSIFWKFISPPQVFGQFIFPAANVNYSPLVSHLNHYKNRKPEHLNKQNMEKLNQLPVKMQNSLSNKQVNLQSNAVSEKISNDKNTTYTKHDTKIDNRFKLNTIKELTSFVNAQLQSTNHKNASSQNNFTTKTAELPNSHFNFLKSDLDYTIGQMTYQAMLAFLDHETMSEERDHGTTNIKTQERRSGLPGLFSPFKDILSVDGSSACNRFIDLFYPEFFDYFTVYTFAFFILNTSKLFLH